ncbi:MAG: glycosyltransferase involved in cell wall biosynthesis [Halieaceae bacterium]|jgi:glycosyltransferase involved in cell wall biosynthesis
MRVILAVDAIFPPLTGIGRYASELVAGLQGREEMESLRFFQHGRFVGQPALASTTAGPKSAGTPGIPLAARLRAGLARSPLAVRAYGVVAPRLAQWRLRAYADHLFHSPNFLLPPFAGPGIATVHDLSTVHYPAYHPAARVALMNRAIPQAVERASALITPSEAVRSEVIAHYGVSGERVHSIPMGVDARYAPRSAAVLEAELAPLGLQAGSYLLCVATLEPRKNIARLLEAFRQLPAPLRQRYPLVLAGGRGWHSDEVYSTIRDLSHSGEVRHLGYVPEAALPALYAGARLFAFPALYEGFGLPVLEAMASGVPVVTSNSSSLPEVAAEAALLVDPHDSTAIASALQRGLEDEDWRHTARAAGLARAAQLSWSRCVETTLELYRSLTP